MDLTSGWLLRKQPLDQVALGVAYRGGQGAYAEDFEALEEGGGRFALRHIQFCEANQAGSTVYCELILAKNVPANYRVPRMSVRSERQSPYRCRNIDIEDRDQEGGVVIGVVSFSRGPSTAVGSGYG